MYRACSLFTTKSIDESSKTHTIIEGIASTPSTDRVGDVVEPLGMQAEIPAPFLLHHKKDQPIGEVFWMQPTKDGIPFKARIPKVAEPGLLKDRLDEAVQMFRYRLIKGISIGFKEIEAQIIKETGGLRFLKWALLELSAVTIPANQDAVISVVKEFDAAILKALDERRRGVVSLTKNSYVTIGLSSVPFKDRKPGVVYL